MLTDSDFDVINIIMADQDKIMHVMCEVYVIFHLDNFCIYFITFHVRIMVTVVKGENIYIIV